MRKLLVVFALLGMMLSGCVYVNMDVENKPVEGTDFSKLKTFAFKQKSESKKDLEAILLNSAKLELESKGFRYDPASPDFVVLVNFGSKAFMERGVTYKREAYEYDYISKTNSEIGVVKDADAPRVDNTVRIYLMTPESEGMKTFLWRGMAVSQDREGLDVVGRCLVKGALIKFPSANGSFREKFNVNDCE
ncbi:DUF4136 domain-containing protein [Maridesulfovibrio sp.]|uniref:DUF4136 domain-containing protein n=1 Tax=Maridesulfovibrio sp. TaxID=2795000 RepID=UPI0029CA5D79|nr:DUF4136 domain-containing protein [Maridesulfovibrio sp.]